MLYPELGAQWEPAGGTMMPPSEKQREHFKLNTSASYIKSYIIGLVHGVETTWSVFTA